MKQLANPTFTEYKQLAPTGRDWNEIVAVVRDLPPLPHIASRALMLVEDPNVNAHQLTTIIQKDTALAARVLKIANSAMFAVQRKITTLNQAIMTIGFKTLKGIILAATLRQINRKQGDNEKLIWENSICTAIAAHSICYQLRQTSADELFLCGLLHDLGKVVLLNQLPKDYFLVMSEVKEGKLFCEAEQDILGFAHPLLGALVAKKWNFSEDTCQIILHHHDPIETEISDPIYLKTAIIKLANAFAHQSPYGNFGQNTIYLNEIALLGNLLGIKEDLLEKLTNRINIDIIEQAGAFL